MLPSLLGQENKDIFCHDALQLFPGLELSEEEKKPAANLDCDEALADPHSPMDAGILSQGLSSTNSSSMESELELFLNIMFTMLYLPCNKVLNLPLNKKDMKTSANTMTEQSNVAGNVHSIGHTKPIMKHMNMYKITGSNQGHEGFKTMDDVAIGIDHNEHYSGVTLTIEKSQFAQ